ncbi:MAG: hypothetical protein R3E32_09160 [Chitinophagales bacterium]
MKKFFYTIAALCFLTFSLQLSAQQTETSKENACKVMMPTLEGTYEGDCKKGFAEGTGKAVGLDQYEGDFKKGLPHGKGTYTWSNGDYYIGNWKNGERNGVGMMRIAGEATTEKPKDREGIWKNGKFVRAIFEANHKFLRKQNVVSASAKKMDDAINRVQTNITNASEVRDLMIINDSGILEQDGNNRITIRDPQFPLHVKINYRTSSKLSGTDIDVVVEYILGSPGNWMVTLRH